jgi:hypothetical protein
MGMSLILYPFSDFASTMLLFRAGRDHPDRPAAPNMLVPPRMTSRVLTRAGKGPLFFVPVPCEMYFMGKPGGAEFRTGIRLGRDFIAGVALLESLQDGTYLVRWGERELIVLRRGNCDYAPCNASCCSILCLRSPWTPYISGFAEKGLASPVVRIACRHLLHDMTCSRWNQAEYPENCKHFPTPGDPMYLEVMDRCSFHFEIVREHLASEALTS